MSSHSIANSLWLLIIMCFIVGACAAHYGLSEDCGRHALLHESRGGAGTDSLCMYCTESLFDAVSNTTVLPNTTILRVFFSRLRAGEKLQ